MKIMIWHFEPKGRFTVKSAYHVACNWLQQSARGISSLSNRLSYSKLWSGIWNASVPPKVRLACWSFVTISSQRSRIWRKNVW